MNESSQRLEAEYDALAFPNTPQLKTHPDNLATLATLFGLRPKPIQGCRVLELGCGSGDNLLPMAVNLPLSEFVGVDLSAKHLARGRRFAEQLGIQNLHLIHSNLLDLDSGELGVFDYIICHGVFSWVSREVQDHILLLAQRHLADSGVLYLSYNAYPGWHLLNMLRQMLLHDAPPGATPQQRVRRARATLSLLESSATLPHNAVGAAVMDRLQHLREHSDGYLFHEYLTEHNEGFWFKDVVERAEHHGLQYLANAIPETMEASNFGSAIGAAVARCDDRIGGQQRLNMALGTPFNSTLFCRQGLAVNGEVASAPLEHQYYDAWLHPDPSEGDVHDTDYLTVTSSSGVSARIAGADLRTALGVLAKARPRNLHFDAIYDAVKRRVTDHRADAPRRQHLAQQMVRLYFGAVVGISTHAPPMAVEIDDYPIASPLARLQAIEQSWVTSQWHLKVSLTEPQRQLLCRLDGTHRAQPQARAELEFLANNALLVR